jgi:adenylate cyclase
MRLRDAKRFTRALTVAGGCALAILAGFACWLPFAEPLTRISYDLPFVWRAALDTHEIVLVYLDEGSAKQLHQPIDDVWNRALHVPLLERLTRDGARLVFYDIIFDTPSPDASRDAAFAEALQGFGKVILGGGLEFVEPTGGVKQERVVAPLKLLRKAAAGWGLVVFKPVDADYGVRQLFPGTSDIPSATWKAAEVLGATSTREPREAPVQRWINYYGPKNTFSSVNLAQALASDGVPPNYFKDKIVMVGGRSAISYLAKAQDEFGTPYSRNFGILQSPHLFTPGLEIHATILLNLLRGDWLTRIPSNWEAAILIIVGLIAGALALTRPAFAVATSVIFSLAIAGLASWLVWHQHVWFDWLVPAGVQIPLGLVWSIGSQYLLESRRRKELRRAFGFYLSPQMADRIADSDFDLKPGGKIVDVTVIFTDLESFTSISENLDPAEVSEILTSYFGQTTKCILENKGTIIKYIGDAVFAAWGAPIDEPHHALCAAEAACDLRGLSELVVRGKTLRTRVGIHSGKVLAGNLGSTFRFDYTMIGDAVNFASRLESLNKYLSTQVLISDAVRQQLGDKFVTRQLGEFRVAGKTHSVVIHELLCRSHAESGEKSWIQIFEQGLGVFRAGKFAEARDYMDRTRLMRGGSDGPSEFYLRKIATLQANGELKEWSGIVELSEK